MSTTAEVLTHTDQEVIDIDADWEPMLSNGKPSHELEAIKFFAGELLLYVRFPGGSIYRYENIPSELIENLRTSESKGSFFIKAIKNGGFSYKKIRDKSAPPPVEIISQSGVDAIDIPLIDEAPVKIELPKLEKEVLTIIDQAKTLQVTNKEEAGIAVAFIRHRRSVLDAFVEWFAPIKKASWEAHKKNTEKEKSIKEPNEEAIRIVKGKIQSYEDEKARLAEIERQRIRKEEEEKERARRAQEEAERRERQRIEDEARAKEEARLKAEREKFEAEKLEQARLLEEAGKKEQAERVLREAAAKAELQKLIDENRRLKEETEKAEKERLAQEALEAPIYIHDPILEVEKIDGLVIPKAWKAEVYDIRALCRGIADGKTPSDVISVNQSKINGLAKTWKEKTGDYHPGLKAYEDKSVRTK